MRGSEKSYGELLLEAQKQTGYQQVGETVEPIMRQLKDILEQIVQMQYDACMKGGFDLPQYYVHIFIVKDPLASQGMETHNVLRIRKPHIRVTRPSPYQDEDHYLWKVTNYDKIEFQWCIPQKEVVAHILSHPNDFDKSYVSMLRKYTQDRIEKLSDYQLSDGSIG